MTSSETCIQTQLEGAIPLFCYHLEIPPIVISKREQNAYSATNAELKKKI